ncbi:MAG: hypothetical protein IPM13_06315 [Phycisphaerales bacterium]|nr:hypothetical protein [Phycisphaerales bacterium]
MRRLRTETPAAVWRAVASVLLVGSVLCTGCAAPGRSAEPLLTEEQRQRNVESFDVVWETVRDRHWDAALGGLDWESVRTELRPRVEQARTSAEARSVMSDALSRLNLTHFGIIPAAVYADVASAEPHGASGECGLTVRVVSGQALVTAVMGGSPAEHAGVRPGWRIVRVNGRRVQPTIDQIRREYAGSTLEQLMLVRAIEAKLDGPVGQDVQVEFDPGEGPRRTLELRRVEPRGKLVQLGDMPPASVWFESRWLPGAIGYITFNIFLDPATIAEGFERAMTEFRTARGIVLDLRGNPGGLGAMSMGVAGWFAPQANRPLGTMRTRGATINFAVFPRPEPYNGPLAILVDGCTASTAEIVAGGLKDLKRARIFGERTAGAALPSIFTRLPNDDGFQYAIADYVSADGGRLEGNGVEPDVVAAPTRAALLAGRDLALEAATAWILSGGTARELAN